MVENRGGMGLYTIIDTTFVAPLSVKDVAIRILKGGAKTIQLRAKDLSSKEFFNLTKELRKIIPEDRLFIVNDRPDIALFSGAGGVHLGQEDLPCVEARGIMGRDKIIGVSTHSLKEALEAERDGADYVAFGPVFETKTKGNAQRPRGLKALKEVKEAIHIPVIAIGGIGEKNIMDVLETGVDGVAVVSDILTSKDITGKVKRLISIIGS